MTTTKLNFADGIAAVEQDIVTAAANWRSVTIACCDAARLAQMIHDLRCDLDREREVSLVRHNRLLHVAKQRDDYKSDLDLMRQHYRRKRRQVERLRCALQQVSNTVNDMIRNSHNWEREDVS